MVLKWGWLKEGRASREQQGFLWSAREDSRVLGTTGYHKP